MKTGNTYKIAGINLDIRGDNKYLLNRLKIFEDSNPNRIDLFAEIRRCHYIEKPEGQIVIDEFVKWMKKDDNGGFHVFRLDTAGRDIMAHMDINKDWSRDIIRCLDIKFDKSGNQAEFGDWMEYYSFMLMGIIFRNRLINMGGIVIHASSIAWRDRGILFTAPSGTGKSTHVRLWEKYLGDEVTVVNDDTPAVRFFDGIPTLCGTPWSGSSDKFANLQVPVGAIVVLRQAPQNSISKLSPLEALPCLMPRAFLPYFDKELMEKAYSVLDMILQKVPVYLLTCTPEKKAMELVYECVKH